MGLLLAKFLPELSPISAATAGAGKVQFLRFPSFIGIRALLFVSMVVGAGRIFHDEVTYIVGMLANVRKYGHFICARNFCLVSATIVAPAGVYASVFTCVWSARTCSLG